MFLVTVSWVVFISVGVASGKKYSRTSGGLTEIPEDIPNDTKVIDLSKNAISHVRSEDLLGLGNLYKFNLEQNELTEFPDLSSVAGTLTQLYLYSNQISSVPAARLNILTKLEWLYLYNNKISFLPDVGGTWLPQANGILDWLDVSNNELTTLPVLYGYTEGLKVSADGNHVVCDERLAWLLGNKVYLLSSPTCSAPESLIGKELSDLSYTDLTSANSKCGFVHSPVKYFILTS